MSIEALPILVPLLRDLKELNLDNFLKSKEFHRYCIRVNFEDSWRLACNEAESQRRFYSMGMDTEAYDSNNALILVINYLFTNTKNSLFLFIGDFLEEYISWSNEHLSNDFIEDLKLLNAPSEVIERINTIIHNNLKGVPQLNLPENFWGAEKLEDVLQKMDNSIQTGEYNLTLTYAYSFLEGLFKAFISKKVSEKNSIDKLNQLASLVRDLIKEDLQHKNLEYPEQIINLIPTISNAISNARNSFSESHFDNNSDKWLAEFSRDCVNSIGRLIYHFY